MRKDIAEYALDNALRSGAQDARVSYNETEQSSVSVLNDSVDRLHHSFSSSLFIQLYVDGRYGSFSTNRMEKEELSVFIKKGIEATRLLAPDLCRKLPDKALYYKGDDCDLLQFDNKYNTIDPQEKKNIALSNTSQIIGKDPRLLSVSCDFEDTLERVYMVDSQGFNGISNQTLYTLSAECSVMGEGDKRPEAYWYDSSMFFDGLKKERCGSMALQRALNYIGSRKIRSGRYNVILENTVSSRMISPIISALNGSSIQQVNSFLIDSKGKKIFPEKMSLTDNPHTKGAMGARYFDSEGIATKQYKIIDEGVIDTYFLNTYYAEKLSTSPTVEGPSVPLLKSTFDDDAGLSQIMQRVDKGVLITGFNGGNFNSSTGDFSYGIQGFYFEKGVIKYPVSEMNMTGNLILLWNNMLYAGNDPRDCAKWLIPTIAFENVDLSGN